MDDPYRLIMASLRLSICIFFQAFILVYAEQALASQEERGVVHFDNRIWLYQPPDTSDKGAISQGGKAISVQPYEPLTAKIISQTPQRRSAALHLAEEGRKFLQDRQYERALMRFEKAVALDANAYSYYYLALTHYLLAHYWESLNFLEVAESWLSEHPKWMEEILALRADNFRALESSKRADAINAQFYDQTITTIIKKDVEKPTALQRPERTKEAANLLRAGASPIKGDRDPLAYLPIVFIFPIFLLPLVILWSMSIVKYKYRE